MSSDNDVRILADWAFGGKQVDAAGVLLVGDTHFIICKAAKGLAKGPNERSEDMETDLLEPTKILWILIVCSSAVGIITYIIRNIATGQHNVKMHRIPLISFDRSELFCDDDDCEDDA